MLLNKRTFLSFLLSVLFYSCSTCPKWEKTDIEGSCISSTRRTFASQSDFNGIELEITSYPEGEFLFANVKGRPLSGQSVEVTLNTPNGALTGQGYVYEGGQRIELPYEWINTIKTLYSEENEVSLNFNRYKATIPANGFYDTTLKIYMINLGLAD